MCSIKLVLEVYFLGKIPINELGAINKFIKIVKTFLEMFLL